MPAGEMIVLVTCPAAEGQKLACAVVTEQLAACVNIVDNVRSIYLWEGQLCNEMEQLLVIKTTQAVWTRLRDRLKDLHSYEVPEIVALSIEAGHQPYLDWLSSAVGATRSTT